MIDTNRRVKQSGHIGAQSRAQGYLMIYTAKSPYQRLPNWAANLSVISVEKKKTASRVKNELIFNQIRDEVN